MADEPSINDICVTKKLKLALNAARMSAYERNIRTGVVTKSFCPIASQVVTSDSRNHLFNSNSVLTSMSYEDSMLSLHPEDRLRVDSEVNQAIKNGTEFQIEFRKYHTDGQLRWIQSNGRAFYADDGTPTYVYAVSQDITDKKILEVSLQTRSAELADTQDQFALALDAAGMAAFESFGKVSAIRSPALKRLMGFANDSPDITLDLFLARVHPDDREMMRQNILSLKSKVEDEFRVVHPNGDVRWLLAKGTSSFTKGNSLDAYIVMQDITERKNSEEQLRKKTEELSLVNQKLERFSAVVAHDLKGPLSSMTMSVDLVENADTLDEAREYLSFIKSGARRMGSLVDDLLTLAKLGNEQSMAPENVALQTVMSTVSANLKSALTTSKALLIVGSEDAHVLGHVSQLNQVFQNLIANSLKFISSDIPIIKISFTEKPDAWLITVKDNGIGMNADALSHLFQPFKRFHASQFEGTGLGLSIVKNIITLHGGKIWVESQPGLGSEFYITIPKAPRLRMQPSIL